MIKWLKNRLGITRLELEIKYLRSRIEYLQSIYTNLAHIGVDVHFKSPHMIIIYSKLNGGQMRHIDASFKTIAELNALVRDLRKKYCVKEVIYDKINWKGNSYE